MLRSQRLRGRACLLLLALVAGGVGLPIADALVFHGRAPAALGERSLADERTPPKNHAQLCVITKGVQAKMALPAFTPTLGFLPPSTETPTHSTPTALRSNSRYSPALPRAPPQSQA